MQELYDFAKYLAVDAAGIAKKYFRSEYSYETKQDDSPVTIADKTIEEKLRKEIEKRFPDDGILGEEFGEKPSHNNRRWIIDPIDGTQSFIRGLPLFGTMIAVEEDGESQIGVIHYPINNETLSAMCGNGCFCNDVRCDVSACEDISQANLSTSYPHKVQTLWGEQCLQHLVKQTSFIGTYDCYGYLLFATGKIDGLFEPELKVWDVAPLFPIVQEAGGVITNKEHLLDLHIQDVVMSNPTIHPQLVQMINDGIALS